MRRARLFWIAFPIAAVFALWAGPGLADEDEMPLPDSAPGTPGDVAPDPVAPPPVEVECEPAHDPGPDGDR